jgi:subtilisin family serine protease
MLTTPRLFAAMLAIASAVVTTGATRAPLPSAHARGDLARVLVRFTDEASSSAEKAVLARARAEMLGTIDRLGIVEVRVRASNEAAALKRLQASPLVAYAERDGLVHADAIENDDPYLGSDYWQLSKPGFPAAWSMSTGRSSTIVAVLDTGVDKKHEDLVNLAPGYNFVDGNQNTSDPNGHGTAVAGIIGAQGNNGKGTAGVCWHCRIMPVKVLRADTSGSWSDVAAGVIWATDHGARVINMSLGLPSGSHTIADAVEYAEKRNVVVVASAGNEDSSAPDYPADYEGVVSVGAVDETGVRYSPSNGNVDSGTWGSNFGSWVAVDAPGCVNSTWPGSSASPNGRYMYFCGTSAAAPFVSGLAGLALSYVPSASAYETADAIETTARQTPDHNSAHGLIYAPAALKALAAMPHSSTVSFVVNAVSGKAPLKVRFANTSTIPGPYEWKFGDGTTSRKASPTHVFKRPGTYRAKLITSGGAETKRIAVKRSRTKISTRLPRKSFRSSQAAKVKLVYRFASPSRSFGVKIERRHGKRWVVVRSVERRGHFRGSHRTTIKRLFGRAGVAPARYRLVLKAGKSRTTVGFVAR